MIHTDDMATESYIPELDGGENSEEVKSFVRESQKILEKLIEENNKLRKDLKEEKALRNNLSQKIVEKSAVMLEEASDIAARYIDHAKEQAQVLTAEAEAYDAATRKEADEYRAAIVNEVETERDLIALEVEELKTAHLATKEKIVSFHKSILKELEEDTETDGNDR